MKSIGLDISTKTGLVILEGEGPTFEVVYHTRIMGEGTGIARAIMIAESVVNELQRFAPAREHPKVIVEGYAYGNKFTLVTLTEIGTAIRIGLLQNQYKWMTCQPSSLKKFLLGKGAGTKKQIVKKVSEVYGFEAPNDDVADAFALAVVGLSDPHYASLRGYQREVLAALKMGV